MSTLKKVISESAGETEKDAVGDQLEGKVTRLLNHFTIPRREN